MNKDVSWNLFFEDNERFADFINACGCKGKPMISPEELVEVDTKAMHRKSVGEKSTVTYRDMIRRVARGINFMIVGIEHQETVNHGMPLTIMGYELGSYNKQRRRITRSNRREKKKLKSGEFLYGLRKEDKLYPVITFVLYTGEVWDGATSLKELLDFTNIPESMRNLVQNYSINLISIREWEDTSIFRTDIKQVFDFIKCSDDKEKLQSLMAEDDNFKGLEDDTYELIKKYGNVKGLNKESYRVEGGKIDMCKAMDDWAKDERENGLREGRETGLREGHESGLREGRLAERRLFVVRMLERNKSDEEIIEITDCTKEELEEIKMKIYKDNK